MNKILNKYSIVEQLLNNGNDDVSHNITKFIISSNKEYNDIEQVVNEYVNKILKPSKYYNEKKVILNKILLDIINKNTQNFVRDFEDLELINSMEVNNDDSLWCKNKYKDGYALFNAILNKIKSADPKMCCQCINAITEKDNAIDIIELLDNAIKVNNGEELKILFKDYENLVPINRGLPIGAYAFGDKFKSFFNNTKKKVEKAVDNIGDGLKKAKDEVVKIANQAGNKISQKLKGTVIEDAVQGTGKLVGKAYDGIQEVKNNIDQKVKNSASKFVDKYGDDNVLGKFAEDIANYDKNNEDINKIKDSNYFSAYKGKKVIKDKLLDSINKNILSGVNKAIDKINKEKDKDAKPSNLKIGSTFGIGDFIVLGENAGINDYGKFTMQEYENDVRHEYGHTKQFDNMGPIKYFKDVAIPSMIGYTRSNKEGENFDYYAQPWERGADINGNVNRGKYYDNEGIGTKPDLSSPYVTINKYIAKLKKLLDQLN